MPTVRTDNRDTDSLFSRPGARTLTFAGCSLAAVAVTGAVSTPAVASRLAPTPPFVHAPATTSVRSPALLMSGATGAAVKQLQRALHVPVTGVFGAGTKQAVVRFQRSHRVQPDGVVGPQTRRELHLRVRIVGSPSGPSGSSTPSGGYSIPASIVMCESGGNYSAVNPSSGAGGAYQILPSTWAAYGGPGLPQNAPPAEQNAIAAKIYASGGAGQWSC